MKKILLLTFICFIILFISSVYALNPNFEISNYHIKLNVLDDNSYEVTETIDVKFNVDRHGIVRKIPLNTYNGGRAKIKDIWVNKSFTDSIENSEIRIKIGDPDKYANRNEIYEIKYLYQKGIDGIDDMDELYFNLIGNGWDVYIRNVTFDITMPFDFDENRLNFTYGAKGSTENELVSYTVNGNRITGRLNKELSPKEALTVALPLPEGYYVNAKQINFAIGTIVNRYYGFIFTALLVMGFLIYFIFGRNKRIYPPIEFYPPRGLTSADIGYIYDGSADPQDVTSLIIYWANRGLLQIREYPHAKKRKKTQIALYKLKDINEMAKDYEKDMFRSLFNTYGDGKIVYLENLKKTFYVTIGRVQKNLNDIWHKNKDTRIYAKKSKLIKFIIVTLSVIAGTLMFLGLFETGGIIIPNEVKPFVVLLSFFWHISILNFTSLMENWKKILPRLRLKESIKKTISLLISIGFVGGIAYYVGNILVGLFGFFTCYLISFISAKCLKRTETGDRFMERILGFRDFILYAERDKINMLVNENPGYFFNVLPYAIVFGITDKWAQKFEGITIPQPSWYQKPAGDNRYYDSYMYTSILTETSSLMASYAGNAPGSSSSGSGGSSDGGSAGGGDGGGGGDDW